MKNLEKLRSKNFFNFFLLILYRVTIIKDKKTRESKGVAFILFVKIEDAQKAVKEMNQTILNGRVYYQNFKQKIFIFFIFFLQTIKVSIAIDNGRTKEFIKKKIYTDKSRCYECGVIFFLKKKYIFNILRKVVI